MFQNPGGYLYTVFEIVRFKYIQNILTISYIHPARHGRFLVNNPFHPCIHLNNFEGSPQCDSPFYVGLYLYARLKIKHSILSKEIIYPVIFFNHRYYASDTNTMAGFIRYRSIINKYGFNSISISDINT